MVFQGKRAANNRTQFDSCAMRKTVGLSHEAKAGDKEKA